MQLGDGAQHAEASGISSEKKSLRAAEQDRPEVAKQRQAWRRKVRRVNAQRFRFIDESGAKTNMTRLYGRCKGGGRLVDATPHGRWETTTMIGALGAEGSTALMVIEGATDAAVFRAYVKHVLVPTLRPGEIVAMDNLSSHKSPEIREMIEAAGAELRYELSPMRNPDPRCSFGVRLPLRFSGLYTSGFVGRFHLRHRPSCSPCHRPWR